MKRIGAIVAGVWLCASSLAIGQAQEALDRAGSATAAATLRDAAGQTVAEARLSETPHGVLLELTATGLAPGVHGLHVHAVGRCDGSGFESAGGHFNPDGREHGFLNPRGPHAGDLPNVHVPASGKLSVEYLLTGVTLGAGERSLRDGDGSAIMIHAGQDDYRSDPAGHAGGRQACGVVTQADAR